MLLYLSILTFFGLTPKYRNLLFTQLHDLVYHGGGGFIHSEVYNMPIWMRRFHIQSINKHLEKENEQIRKAQGNEQLGDDKKILGPNVNPSSTYNF
mgnify:FL=1|jgi:hypothetical protein